MDAPRPTIRAALEHSDVVWLGSVRSDGRPHLVPVWFVWDGSSFVVFSKPHAQKVANIRADPRVTVAIGQPDERFDVELVEGIGQLEPARADVAASDAFAAKYRRLAATAGVTIDQFASIYSQAIRIHPLRWLGWGGTPSP
ncbi:MAG TPA: pyridoxamine 5'-phosphate oxidase family protein [Candidatus Limnocylindrales bacterium]|nr:pyridoxamine 5'-phosphate oxidase family protein [Candidatus Limnocylindrales bacterium]